MSVRHQSAVALRRITPPAETPVSLAEVKAHCRVDGNDSDAVLTLLLSAAVDHLDGMNGLGRAIMTQTWELVLDAFPGSTIQLPLGPLASVTSVVYDDEDGTQQTVDAANYIVDTAQEIGWVVPVAGYSWPSTFPSINAVRVRFVAGYATSTDVPFALKAAILLIVSHWNENREASTDASLATIPLGVANLVAPYRVFH